MTMGSTLTKVRVVRSDSLNDLPSDGHHSAGLSTTMYLERHYEL
jgi:hypothetical protein